MIKRILFLTVLLTACGGGGNTNDTLVFGRGSDSIGLDPGLENDGESFKVCDNIYETLVAYESESTAIVPQLAHSWDVSADQLTWTFHLHTDITAPTTSKTRLAPVPSALSNGVRMSGLSSPAMTITGGPKQKSNA